MLWKAFEAMREEVMGDWWRMHNVEIHDLYSSPNVIQVIRSRTIRCEKHVIYIYIHIYIYINTHTYIYTERGEGYIGCW